MLGKEIAAILQEVNSMIVENFNSSHEISIKSDQSIVTKTDREVEQVLMPRLEELLPGSSVVGEESSSNGPEDVDTYFRSEYLWAVDPIDGTVNFASGLPLFTVSVGLFKRNEKGYSPVSGAISFPAFSEVYFTGNEKTFLRNMGSGKETEVKRVNDDLVLTLIIPNSFVIGQHLNRQNRLTNNIRLLGSTAADMLYVGLGKASATITIAHLWDFAGALAIAKTQNLYPRDLSTGRIKKSFSKEDFSYGEPKLHWRLKRPLVLCPEEYFPDVQELFKS